MKFVAIADLHSKVDPKKFRNLRKYKLVIINGDFTDYGKPKNYTKEVINEIGKERIFAVHGNMDTEDVLKEIEKQNISIHEKRKKFGDYFIVGFGGSNKTPFNTPTEYEEDEIYSKLNDLEIDEKTILVTHAPPYGYFDEVGKEHEQHAGSKSIAKIIEEKRPLINICAHIHENCGFSSNKIRIAKLPPATSGKAMEIEVTRKKKKKKIEEKEIKIKIIEI